MMSAKSIFRSNIGCYIRNKQMGMRHRPT